MKKILKIILVIILIALFVGTLVYLYQKEQEPPVVYKTESPFTETIINKTVATGSVVPRKEIEIKPVVSGIVENLYVEAGQKIKKGDKIARIRIIPDMAQMNNAQNRVALAKIALQNAQTDYDRNRSLLDQKVIAKAQFQPFQLSLNQAKEEVKTAENNLAIIKDGVSKQAGSSQNTIVTSTIDGMVLDVPVEEGNSVIERNNFNEGTSIASVADMGEMVFEGTVDESEVGKIGEGMDIILNIGAIEDKQFNAKLEFIAPKGVEDEGAILFDIKAAVETVDSVMIRAGYSANADIVLNRVDDVLAIKESLVIFDDGKTYVEVETSEQEFEKREVKLGLSDGISIEVLSGINEDDKLKVQENQAPAGGKE